MTKMDAGATTIGRRSRDHMDRPISDHQDRFSASNARQPPLSRDTLYHEDIQLTENVAVNITRRPRVCIKRKTVF